MRQMFGCMRLGAARRPRRVFKFGYHDAAPGYRGDESHTADSINKERKNFKRESCRYPKMFLGRSVSEGRAVLKGHLVNWELSRKTVKFHAR